ncbi:NFU1 iron-sulfur cluster scaffold homolog, mitochondrial [Copidosoma floridanum]|uniref:NFU1 iron-sulfur cluster scaffold homolog, mitochondrial n=1 Tax=Copidosoma floridanum TaxID=29053 RepID=UPI0006C96873|nr:NFU1 iron-sulfur cluster scaffold homolog, mitochondrial [Copidosoma floridanum]
MSIALRHSKPKLHLLVDQKNVNFWQMPKSSIFIQARDTPNPNSKKFVPDVEVLGPGRTKEFSNAKDANCSPLAKILFDIKGVKYVFFGPDFITVIKTDDSKWQFLKPEIISSMTDFFASGLSILPKPQDSPDTFNGEDDEVVRKIKEVIDTKVRPRAQEDGGDLVFMGFENGIVKLKMRGTCTSCPNSVETLKNGVQNMLQFYVPDVLGVERVDGDATKTPVAELDMLEKKKIDKYSVEGKA